MFNRFIAEKIMTLLISLFCWWIFPRTYKLKLW